MIQQTRSRPREIRSTNCELDEVRPHMRNGLGFLLQAFEYSTELQQGPWDLAVELDALREARLNTSDLRWLSAKGYIEHAIEITKPHDQERQFQRTELLNVSEASCVVLTPRGVALARKVLSQRGPTEPARPAASAPAQTVRAQPIRPSFDSQRRQLRLGDAIIKEFKLPSPNQEAVLLALEEEGWPPRIDDPLPPSPDIVTRRRLHDTIKALNRKQKSPLIRFMGDGSGEGVRWELRK
jgi:hypothetical protein